MPHEGQIGIFFESEGYRLLGRLFLARGDSPKPTALILHGIPGIEQNYDLAHALRDHGWNSLIFHYRGCWGSAGSYTLKTIPADVRAALDELSRGRYPQIDPTRLILIGHSLGGWAAILSAVDDPRMKGTAVIGAVTNPNALPWDADFAAIEFTPWLQGMTPQAFEQQWQALDSTFTPIEQVARLAPRPLLIIHSRRDEVVPLQQAKQLYDRAAEPRQLIIHAEANHAFTWHRTWLRERIVGWLERFNPSQGEEK
jgi:pimeloyl-ACP methyl ester carboxylesterase